MRVLFHSCMAFAFAAYWTVATAQVPLPSDITVIPPGSDVRRELGAFSGRWIASWSGVLDSVFIVESINNERAEIIYAWGDAPRTTKGYVKKVAKVLPGDGAELEFSGGNTSFTAVMSDDLSTIRMTRVAPVGTLTATFKRADARTALPK
jgi:hypothetical protein